MNLHKNPTDFRILITLTADYMHLPESAIERDYYIVLMLKKLSESDYVEKCVFKGGTSLSKCYPNSIERFSEDIDLTYLGMDESDNKCDKELKRIEKLMTITANTRKIESERSPRNKSMYVWFDSEENKVKLEIGCSVRPDPYSKKELKTYIQEFLETHNGEEDIKLYGLESFELNVLNIERTFIDKIMSVKRHAICGTLLQKVRHIYDVKRIYSLSNIQHFLTNKEELKRIVRLTKETDSYYLKKRDISPEYNPTGPYDFNNWKKYFTTEIKINYESLHEDLLYTNEKQNFVEAIKVFEEIDIILKEINE